MKKINTNKDHRLKEIRNLAILIENPKLKSLKEIRNIAETIELLADEKTLNDMNKAIDDYKNGRYEVISSEGKGKNKVYSIYSKKIPHVVTQGKTIIEAETRLKEALKLYFGDKFTK